MTHPPNAFDRAFLEARAEHDEPGTAGEAEVAGPWKDEPAGALGFAVLREAESLAEGDRPAAVFFERSLALLAAALLPATGGEPALRLGREPDRHGFPVLEAGKVVGYLRLFDESLLAALNHAHHLARSPRSLALLLDAVGGLGLELAGRILAREPASR